MTGPVRPATWWRKLVLDRQDPGQNRGLGSAPWWKNAVIYQIGAWSFQDSDGDGKGDLGGVIQRLDYLSSLGADAIWLTPVYQSPMDDYGYDITDWFDIGAPFGTMEQFDRLLALVHQRGMKLILDAVWNHTSDQHPWFQDSRRDRDGRHADWYVWADPRPDGGPPNNWRSAFNGDSGWKYVEARKQYYFFHFLDSQPDLNWHNPEVREMALRCARFWLERGVDGMRLDAVNFFCHDPELRDDPVREPGGRPPDGIDPRNPAARNCFVNSFCRTETLEHLRAFRELSDEYPGTMLLGEVTLCEDTLEHASLYVKGDKRLHLAYHSALHFFEPLTATRMRDLLRSALSHYGEDGICWIVGNHDYGRTRSYWGGREDGLPDDFYKMIAAMLVTLPGALCLWQGDELGLPEARIPGDISKSQIKDPFGRLLYPDVKGRDGSRTPMPWNHDAHLCGFSSADAAWLPIPESHKARAVDLQSADPASLLNRWREILHWRTRQPALLAGLASLVDVGAPDVLAILREESTQRLLCLFNIQDRDCEVDLSGQPALRPLACEPASCGFDAERRRLRLAPWGAWFGELTAPGGKSR